MSAETEMLLPSISAGPNDAVGSQSSLHGRRDRQSDEDDVTRGGHAFPPPDGVGRHGGGAKASYIDGINTAIYYYKNSHSHMIQSHNWLAQQL